MIGTVLCGACHAPLRQHVREGDARRLSVVGRMVCPSCGAEQRTGRLARQMAGVVAEIDARVARDKAVLAA